MAFCTCGIVVVQIGLVMEEAMPVVFLAGVGSYSPVGRFCIDEDDARIAIPLIGIAPHVLIAVGGMIRMGGSREA